MNSSRRNFLHLAAGAAAFPAVSHIARAHAYPTKPITMVVPFAAGGNSSVVGRVIAERMQQSLGQTVIVENVGGANGSIGVGRVARAAPDGYTVALGSWGTFVANGPLYALPYDLLKDFEPIALISGNPWLIAAKKTSPANDLKGLIAWLKANPDRASAGTAGIGSSEHVAGVLFQNITGTSFQFVPYRGGGPAMQDLVAGQIDLMFQTPNITLPQLRAGKIKVFAVTAKSGLAEVPSVDAAGLPEFYFSNWNALFGPKGTPKNVIDNLNSAVVAALGDPAIRLRLSDMGTDTFPREQQTPEALRIFQKAQIEKWWPIIKAANIKAD